MRSDKQEEEDEEDANSSKGLKSPLKSLNSSSKWERTAILRERSVQSFLKGPPKPAAEIRTTSWTRRRSDWIAVMVIVVVVESPATAVASPPAIGGCGFCLFCSTTMEMEYGDNKWVHKHRLIGDFFTN